MTSLVNKKLVYDRLFKENQNVVGRVSPNATVLRVASSVQPTNASVSKLESNATVGVMKVSLVQTKFDKLDKQTMSPFFLKYVKFQ